MYDTCDGRDDDNNVQQVPDRHRSTTLKTTSRASLPIPPQAWLSVAIRLPPQAGRRDAYLLMVPTACYPGYSQIPQ